MRRLPPMNCPWNFRKFEYHIGRLNFRSEKVVHIMDFETLTFLRVRILRWNHHQWTALEIPENLSTILIGLYSEMKSCPLVGLLTYVLNLPAYLLTYLVTYSLTFFFTYLLTYLLHASYLLTYLLIYINIRTSHNFISYTFLCLNRLRPLPWLADGAYSIRRRCADAVILSTRDR